MADAEPPPGGQRWTRQVLAVVVSMVVLGLLVLLLWPGTQWWVEHVDGVQLDGPGAVAGKDRQEVLDKARGRITGIATGLLAAVAIYYTASNAASARRTAQAAQESVDAARRSAEITEEAQRRTFELTQQGQRASEEAQRRTHELTERGQLTDRFTAAVAQLGDPSPAIQLGGVHALAGIADDAADLRQTCIDVLCAYLRLPHDPDPGNDPAHAEARKAYRALREVRHTIIRIIGTHLRDPDHGGAAVTWQGHDFDFTDVVFDGGDLHGARFTGGTVSFKGAEFAGGMVDFRGAEFADGTVDFIGAEFTGSRIYFTGAMFSGGAVDFMGAEFADGAVDFQNAEFAGSAVNFRFARFSGCAVGFGLTKFTNGTIGFGLTEFSGSAVEFMGAEFSGGTVSFTGATFVDDTVSFVNATFIDDTVDFGLARFSGGTVNFAHARGPAPQGLLPAEGEGLPPGVQLPGEWTIR